VLQGGFKAKALEAVKRDVAAAHGYPALFTLAALEKGGLLGARDSGVASSLSAALGGGGGAGGGGHWGALRKALFAADVHATLTGAVGAVASLSAPCAAAAADAASPRAPAALAAEGALALGARADVGVGDVRALAEAIAGSAAALGAPALDDIWPRDA
jgi:hypothetical protein